jgi:hypothetical protein
MHVELCAITDTKSKIIIKDHSVNIFVNGVGPDWPNNFREKLKDEKFMKKNHLNNAMMWQKAGFDLI